MSVRLNAAQPYAIGLFRVVLGLLFAVHGAASLFGVLGGAAGTDGGTIAAGTWPGWYAAVIQLVAGVLVLLGLGTRGAALVASGSMAFAYFDVHQQGALWPIQNGGELSVLFCWGFFLLVFTGSGAYGLDRLVTRRTAATADPAADRAPIAA
ncbi:DoxX family protein [Streptomyces sp. LP11]|uniref:DoxX family protein n=1 Tax=Streptomyces pyxinicus TaxID=2970331 RepID=A0ABT2AYT3_9ACTN|nr:DoxX family protein [Streptomyces sp. LP11]MCS0601291.1 DoxX family protein [Streptomyces sp. LP11]